jgi:hypothetical protein
MPVDSAHAALAAALLSSAASLAHAQDFSPTLEPGASTIDCASALRPGIRDCAPGNVAAAPARLEALVDRYLADYGKPPREAVRALLDPSDANIRAMVQKQEETMAVASYVAARMTAVEADAGAQAVHLSVADALAFRKMRIVLTQRPQSAQAQPALRLMRMLALRVPFLQARVELVGDFDPQSLRRELAAIPAPLDVAIVDPGMVDASALPFLRLEDVRNGLVRFFDARTLSFAQLRSAAQTMREAARQATEVSVHGAPHVP